MKLERSTYDKVQSMIESPDDENILMGLSCIENSDFKENMIFILLMLKETNVSIDEWSKHARNTLNNIKNIGVEWDNSITYKMIQDVIDKYDLPQSDRLLFEDRFSTFVKKRVTNSDHLPEILSLTVKIKFKNYESVFR